MKALKLPCIIFALFLYSCSKYDGNIYVDNNKFYIENTSGDKILNYTIEKTRSQGSNEWKEILFIRLNPGEYKILGIQTEKITVAPTEIFRIDTLKGILKWPKMIEKFNVGKDFKFTPTNTFKKNPTPPKSQIQFDLDLNSKNESFLSFFDSTDTKDTVYYNYRYTREIKTGTMQNPSIENKYNFKIKGAVLYNPTITPIH